MFIEGFIIESERNKFLEKLIYSLLLIDNFIKTHTMKKEAHEELMAMSYLDKDIKNIFKTRELTMTDKISNILINSGFNSKNMEEKVHIIIGIIDNYCHEVVYHKHEKLDYNAMKEEILNIIINVITE